MIPSRPIRLLMLAAEITLLSSTAANSLCRLLDVKSEKYFAPVESNRNPTARPPSGSLVGNDDSSAQWSQCGPFTIDLSSVIQHKTYDLSFQVSVRAPKSSVRSTWNHRT